MAAGTASRGRILGVLASSPQTRRQRQHRKQLLTFSDPTSPARLQLPKSLFPTPTPPKTPQPKQIQKTKTNKKQCYQLRTKCSNAQTCRDIQYRANPPPVASMTWIDTVLRPCLGTKVSTRWPSLSAGPGVYQAAPSGPVLHSHRTPPAASGPLGAPESAGGRQGLCLQQFTAWACIPQTWAHQGRCRHRD